MENKIAQRFAQGSEEKHGQNTNTNHHFWIQYINQGEYICASTNIPFSE